MKNLTDWANIFVALGGFTGLSLLVKEFYKLYMRKKNTEVNLVIKRESQIYDQLDNILQKSSAQKVVLLMLHNGGNSPRAGKPLYSSITHEVSTKGHARVADSWQNMRVDDHYVKKMCSMIGAPNELLLTRTEDMPEGSKRRIICESLNVVKTKICVVYTFVPTTLKLFKRTKDETTGKLWYISIVWTEDVPITAEDRGIILSGINNIRTILEKQYKYD